MKYFAALLLVITSWGDLDKIATINKLKKEAKQAYLDGKYEAALTKYVYLTDSMNVVDDDIALNMSNAYFHLQDTTNALNGYSDLTESKNKVIKSVAHQQLGVMSNRTKKYEEALAHFKNALRADPTNEEARFNYEMLKKVLDEQKKQEQDQQQNKDDQKQDQQQKQDQDQQQKDQKEDSEKGEEKDSEKSEEKQKSEDGEESEEKQEQKEQQSEEEQKDAEKKEEEQKQSQESEEDKKDEGEPQPQSLSEKLQEMKISEEKAKMILEAMKNNEVQYYQQRKKKPTKKKDKSKPDW